MGAPVGMSSERWRGPRPGGRPATLRRPSTLLSAAIAAAAIAGAAVRDPLSPHALAQPPVRLTVVGGSGAGAFQRGAAVHVEPFRVSDQRVFRRWEGDLPAAVRAADRGRAHLAFAMPDHDVTVTATFAAAPLWALDPVPVEGSTVHVLAPRRVGAVTAGTLVLLHDAGEGAASWRASAEAWALVRQAAARGHGLVVVESTDRAAGRWDTAHADLGANPDLRRVRAGLHAAGIAGPLVFLGIGQGGDFAALAAHAFMPLSSVWARAAVLVGSAGDASPAAEALPTLFVLSARDDAALNAAAEARRAGLVAAGVTAEIETLEPWPIFPRSFWPCAGFTAQDSVDVFKAVQTAGLVDPDGWVARDPAAGSPPALPADLDRAWPCVAERLTSGWAGHGLSARAAEAVLDFAERQWPAPLPGPTPEPTRMAYAAQVSVVNGSRGKSEQFGTTERYGDRDVVHIWADPDPEGQVFDRWAGDADRLADARARHTTFMVTTGRLVFTATYRAAPAWRPAERAVDGRQVFFHAPPDPVGLIFFFHGAGGGAAGWVAPRNLEQRRMLRDAVARGYAVAISESGDRQARQWSPDPPEANDDVRHIRRLHDLLVAEGAVGADAPVFGVGMSNGGGFVSRVADALGWRAAAVYAAACRPALAETTTVPLAWRLAENDRRVSNLDAFACHARLKARGIDTELSVNAPSPVYPERFAAAPGATRAESRAVHDALRAARLLDRLDFQVLPPSESDWAAAIAAAAPGIGPAVVGEQLDVCWTEHQLYSDADHLTLDFFDRQRSALPPTVSPPPTGTATAQGTPSSPPTATPSPAPMWQVALPVAHTGGG